MDTDLDFGTDPDLESKPKDNLFILAVVLLVIFAILLVITLYFYHGGARPWRPCDANNRVKGGLWWVSLLWIITLLILIGLVWIFTATYVIIGIIIFDLLLLAYVMYTLV